MRSSLGVLSGMLDDAAPVEDAVCRFAVLEGEFSVYVHLPFCAGKCPYCSFFSVVPHVGEIEEYCRSVRSEIRFFGDRLSKEKTMVRTLYFGGGTPSLLPTGEWSNFFGCIRESLPLSCEAEITVEANPESLSPEHVSVWRDCGVSRISVGVQSLSDSELRWLGRRHDAERARRALEMSVRADFSVSADFIFGLGGQNLRTLAASVSEALASGVEHLSLYQLAVDEKCEWYTSPPKETSDGYPLYRWSQWHLPREGFAQYEISSFARPGKECRHNRAYWTNSPVLAIGAGAWGYVDGVRYRNEESLQGYATAVRGRGNAIAATESPDPRKRAREAAVLLLRTSHGIDYDTFSSRYGHEELRDLLSLLDEKVPSDCFTRDSSSLAFSPKGMRVANSIWSLIV